MDRLRDNSEITLAWLKGHPTRWTTFVANRVAEIQETLPTVEWHFIPGNENPTDIASRGLTPLAFKEHLQWWNGPNWLQSQDETMLRLIVNFDSLTTEEERPVKVLAAATPPQENEILLKFSSLTKLIRVTAWCRRWILRKDKKLPDALTTAELLSARNFWIKETQGLWFPSELSLIAKNKALPSRSSLASLTPYVDSDQLMRLGGRLVAADISTDQRDPIILPRDAHITKLIIDACHRRVLHGGTQLTLATIRQRYWILGGRKAVKAHIHRCVTCVR